MHTHTDTHRGPLTRLPAPVHSHTHSSRDLYPSTYGPHMNSQARLHTHYTCAYCQGSFHTIMLMPRQVICTYMYTASHIQYKFCLCTHTPCMCTHVSYVGLCQCAHTQAAHNPIQMPPSTHMRRNQSEELCKSHRPCLRAWAAPVWMVISPSSPSLHRGHSTQDNDRGAHTQVTGLRGSGGKQRVASKEKWRGGAPPPPLPSQGSLYSPIKPNCFTNYRSHTPIPQPLPCQTAARESALWFSFFLFFKYLYIFILRILYIYNM